jgi:hypothetical protein
MGSEHTEAFSAPAASTTTTSTESDTGHPGISSGTASALDISDRDLFLVDCLRNARYHEDRERFFARIHKIAMFVVVTSGTATFAWVKAAPILAGIITLAGLLDLVFDISGKARLHASLRRRIYDILAQLEDRTRSLDNLREQAIRIYADEPPCMHAVNIIAFNGAMDFLHRPKIFKYQVRWYQRFLRHWCSFASTDFKTYGQLSKSE